MANKRIQDLPIVPSIDGSEEIPINKGGITNKATTSQIKTYLGITLESKDNKESVSISNDVNKYPSSKAVLNAFSDLKGSSTKSLSQIETDYNSKIGKISKRCVDFTTDNATTRLQINETDRTRNFMLSYNIKTEQYIGSIFSDAEWIKDTNWITLETQNNKNAANGYVGLDANKRLANEFINTNFRKGFGYIFDGIDDYLTVQHNDKLNFGVDDFSIEIFFKTKVAGVNKITNIFAKHDAILSPYKGISVYLDNRVIVVRTTAEFFFVAYTLSQPVETIHLVITRSGNRWKSYVNGFFIATATEINPNTMSTIKPLIIGGTVTATDQNVILLRLFNRELSQSDVTYYENSGRPDLQRLKYTDKITNCILELLPENALPNQWLESQNSLNAITSGNPAINTETPVTDYSIVDNVTNNIAIGTANRDYTLPAGYIVDSVCVNSTVALTALQLVNVTNSETLLTGKTVSASANKHLPITADQSSSKVDSTIRLNCAGNTGLGFNIVINIKKCL